MYQIQRQHQKHSRLNNCLQLTPLISPNHRFRKRLKEAQEIDKEQKSNVVNLEIEKKEPKIFDEKKILKDEPLVLIEEPLVLTNEVEVKKESNNLKVKNKRRVMEEAQATKTLVI